MSINKTKTKPKTDAKNQVGETVPKVQIGQTSSSLIIDPIMAVRRTLSFSLFIIRFCACGAVWKFDSGLAS